MSEHSTRKSALAQILHEALFSLNVGFSATFAVLTFAYGGGGGLKRSAFYFLRPGEVFFLNLAAKIDRLLPPPDYGFDTGREIASCALIFLLALAAFLLLRLFAGTALLRALLYPAGGLAGIALLPSLYEHALQSSWGVYGGSVYPFWRSSYWSFFALEVPLVCAFFFLTRKWRYQVWVGAVVLLFHYTLWTGQLLWTFYRIPVLFPKLFYFVFPCSGFAWLFYSRRVPGPERVAQRPISSTASPEA